MENSLKQRIIGAIVLVALGVIFLPAILKEKTSNGVFKSQIPEKPRELAEYQMDTYKIDQLLLEENKKAKEIKREAIKIQKDTLKEEAVIAAVVKSKVDEVDSKQLVSNTDSLGKVIKKKEINAKIKNVGAWILQVASFSNKNNATDMVKKLQLRSHSAYTDQVNLDDKELHRVFVGPFVKKNVAESALLKVENISKTKVLLKTYNPVQH